MLAIALGYSLDCQPAEKNNFYIEVVHGYIFNLTNPKGFKLFYVDLTVKGCPQIMVLQNAIYNFGAFNEAVLHGPTPMDGVYFGESIVVSEYNIDFLLLTLMRLSLQLMKVYMPIIPSLVTFFHR